MPLMPVRMLLADKVINDRGEILGLIEDLVMDSETGQITHLILSLNGVFGLDSKVYALPFACARLDRNHKALVLDVDKDWLDKTTGFQRGQWPDLSAPVWAKGRSSGQSSKSTH